LLHRPDGEGHIAVQEDDGRVLASLQQLAMDFEAAEAGDVNLEDDAPGVDALGLQKLAAAAVQPGPVPAAPEQTIHPQAESAERRRRCAPSESFTTTLL
jgi:hypothetical protein